MKISEITPNKTYFYSEQLTSDIIKWPLLNKLTNLHMHQNSSKLFPPITLKETLYFKFNFFGFPLDPHFYNTHQQNIFGQHENHPNTQTIIYHNLFSHHTIIQSKAHQNQI